MNLGDLLSELRVNILNDRSDRTAGASDYLWTDATLVRYINEAQRRFARRALVIRDGTSDATKITLVAGQAEYPLDQAFLGILSAKIVGDTADLIRAGHAAFDTYRVPDSYFFDTSQLSTLPPGKPVAWSTDEYLSEDDHGSAAAMTLRVYPVPDVAHAGAVIQLRVVRLPYDDLVPANLQAIPEIPPDHHIEMLDWAAYLALRIVDQDAGNANLSDKFRASFEGHVQLARDSVMRKLFAPQQWGFGRNGFTWEP